MSAATAELRLRQRSIATALRPLYRLYLPTLSESSPWTARALNSNWRAP